MIPNLETLQILNTQFSAAFKAGLPKARERWDLIATRVPSSTQLNTYAWLGDFPQMRKWVGDRIVRGLKGKPYILENEDWELTLGVPRKAIEDDQFGIYMPIAEQMGQVVASHPGKLAFQALQAGGDPASLGYDGKPFFAADHPVGAGTDSNDLGGAGPAHWYLLDTTQVLKPLIYQERRAAELIAKNSTDDDNMFWEKQAIWGADGRYAIGYAFWQTAVRSKQTLDDTNLAAAVQAMREMKNDSGEALDITPNLLVVPPALEITARKLLESVSLANGASNIMKGAYQLHVSNFLS